MSTKLFSNAQGNIIREVAVSVASVDFVDESGFFIRSGAGDIKYCPFGVDADSGAITKTVEEQVYFVDPVVARKIFSSGTTATGIVVGYGV
jgi:hypothetical protein